MDREELLRRFPGHRGRLVARLARLVEPAAAEDLAEETLLRALAAAPGFRGDAALGTWLYRIGTNLAYDLLRRRRREAAEPPPAAADEPVRLEDAVAQGQMSRCVQEVLAGLPAHQRHLLIQADVLERSAPEIARDAGISSGNAKIRLHRARRAMKAALAERCALYRREDGVLCCLPK